MGVISVKIGTMEYFVADNIAVPHCFTTRTGGVSTGIFDSLNLSQNRGDPTENVVENFRRIGAVLGFTPDDVVNARQIHSDIVVAVGKENRGNLTVSGASPNAMRLSLQNRGSRCMFPPPIAPRSCCTIR